jgi:hypothetical protein
MRTGGALGAGTLTAAKRAGPAKKRRTTSKVGAALIVGNPSCHGRS